MKAVAAVMFLALATSAYAADSTEVKGTLCFVSAKRAPDCRPTSGMKLSVSAVDAERSYVWFDAAGKQLVFGVLPAKSETIDLAPAASSSVTLSLRGDRLHGWPEEALLHVAGDKKHDWTWRIPAKTVESLASLRLPAGKYNLTFSADHHLTEERRIEPPKSVALREVRLRPMPAVGGRVLSMKDQPIEAADIVRADGKVIASTGGDGKFRGEAGEPLPDTVIVQKAGFGSRVIPIELTGGDKDLGAIRLSAGLKLTLRIRRPEGSRAALRAALQRKTERKYEYTPVTSREIAADDEKIVFEDLSSGDYAVVLEGKEPLERLTTEFKLDADAEKEIRIEPYRLDGTAHIGEDPIDGDLGIVMTRFGLNMKLPIEKGQFGGTLWQHGALDGFVKAKEMGSYEPVKSPELGTDPSSWDIRFPKRLISGRIYDAETRKPVEGAKLELLRTASGSRWYGTIHIQDDGSFSILAVKAGTYELTVTAPDYLDTKQTVEIAEGDESSVQRDFALARGQLAKLEAVWPNGAPVANAVVLDGIATDGYQAQRQYTLDASGSLSLRLQRNEQRTLYIVPQEGSFAIVHLAPREESDTNATRVIVPQPAGSLRIAIKTSDGKEPARAGVGMRFNGEAVPSPVLYEIGFRVEPSAMNDRLLLQLPAGAYELWPVSVPPWTASTPLRLVIGDVKRVALSAGAVDVALVTNQ